MSIPKLAQDLELIADHMDEGFSFDGSQSDTVRRGAAAVMRDPDSPSIKAQAFRDAADRLELLRPEMGLQINVTEYRRGKDDALILAQTTLRAEADRLQNHDDGSL